LRVLHVGNIANNAYLNAKFLRRVGVEADALCDEWHIFCQPEWEDADLDGAFEPEEELAQQAAERGWTQPDWVFRLRTWDPGFRHEPWLKERLLVLRDLPGLVRRRRELRRLYEPVRAAVGRDLSVLDLVYASVWKRRLGRELGSLDDLFARYDVVQLYGAHPALLALPSPPVPYVAFEHGTMREVPFEDAWRGRLLGLGYHLSAKVIITNPDVPEQARILGLAESDYTFVPHPLDETKYTTGQSKLRRELEAEGFDFVLLCPSRHDWHVKGTDRLLHGFVEFVRSTRPKAVLILFDWGQEVERSRKLVQELDINENIRWSPPMPKLRLIDAYRGADVVLDQFLIGTFGAVAPEAMACGCPVVMAFDPQLHRWCFPVMPPVVDARTPEQIHDELSRLAADEEARRALGASGRGWVERHHGWRLITERQVAIYEEVTALSSSRRARPRSEPPGEPVSTAARLPTPRRGRAR
jgi:glycosyltransferase involved in cell wall biosynthesis